MTSHARTVRVATITVSDTRTEADDVSGSELRARIEAAGFCVSFRAIVKDEPDELRALVVQLCDSDAADAVITTGGTGIAPRDRSYEAIEGLLDKRLDGFGEAFRRLSWEQVGPRTVLSRAVAGVHGTRIVVALPGSPGAVALAIDLLVAPILAHAVSLARGDAGGGH